MAALHRQVLGLLPRGFGSAYTRLGFWFVLENPSLRQGSLATGAQSAQPAGDITEEAHRRHRPGAPWLPSMEGPVKGPSPTMQKTPCRSKQRLNSEMQKCSNQPSKRVTSVAEAQAQKRKPNFAEKGQRKDTNGVVL